MNHPVTPGRQTSGAELNPLSPEFPDDPFDAFNVAREECPVHHTTKFSPEFYSITRFADIMEALADDKAEVWTARTGSSPQFNRPIGFNDDVEESQAFRALFRKWLAPTAGKINADLIGRTINDLIDEMTVDGRTRGDFATEFAVLLPIRVIAHLIGVPQDDASEIKSMTDEFLGAFGVPDPRAVVPAVRRLSAYFEPHLEMRRQLLADAEITDPDESLLGNLLPDDLLSYMLVLRHHDRPLSRSEINYVLATALTGGNDTTTSLLTNVMYRLLGTPGMWQRVVEEKSLISTAIEESLRFDPPVLGLFRSTKEDREVSGCPISKDSKVMLLFAAGNRDPRQWEDPDQFSLDRSKRDLRRHLSFGAGAHFCLGAPLARAEANQALDALRTRMPHLRLDGESERIPQKHLWGRQHLPVRWDAPAAASGNE